MKKGNNPTIDETQGFQYLGYSNCAASSANLVSEMFQLFTFILGAPFDCLFRASMLVRRVVPSCAMSKSKERLYMRERLSPPHKATCDSTGKRRKRKAGRTARAYCTHLAPGREPAAAAGGPGARAGGAYWATRRRRSTGAPQHRRAAPTRRRWRVNSPTTTRRFPAGRS